MSVLSSTLCLQLGTIYKDGCFDKLEGDLLENVTILGGVAIGIGCVQVRLLSTCAHLHVTGVGKLCR